MGGKLLSNQEWADRINKIGQASNPKFSFVREVITGKKARRAILRHDDSGEEREMAFGHLTAGKNPWGRKDAVSDMAKKVNTAGQLNNPKYFFVKEAIPNGKNRRVEIKRFDTGETKIIQINNAKWSNPWGTNARSVSDIKSIVNKLGKDCPDPYHYIRYVETSSEGKMVEVQNIKYPEQMAIRPVSYLQKGYNPFGRVYTEQEVRDIVDPIGIQSDPPFKMVKVLGPTADKHSRLVCILNLETNQQAVTTMKAINADTNPWRNLLSDQDIKDLVNSQGKKAIPQFQFVSIEDRKPPIYVKIQEINTREFKDAPYPSIRRGTNPFDINSLHEIRVVQPMIAESAKILGFQVEKEVLIGPGSRVDFVLTNLKGLKILVECKSDKTAHSSNELNQQISRYTVHGKEKYQQNFKDIFLVSLEGKYGISLNALKEELERLV